MKINNLKLAFNLNIILTTANIEFISLFDMNKYIYI